MIKYIKNIILLLFSLALLMLSNINICAAQQLSPFAPSDNKPKLADIAPWSNNNQNTQTQTNNNGNSSSNSTAGNTVPASIAKPKSNAEIMQGFGAWSGGNIDSEGYTAQISDPKLFDRSILDTMHKFMVSLYSVLGKVFMIGHSLICYSINVARTCIPADGWFGIFCWFKLPDLTFLFAGCVIYVTAVLMTMSIGMYFIDIALKLGFAVMMLPISIALWPFPPTKNKLQDTLSIIIRNAMLFMVLAVGVVFAISIISNGLFESGEDNFWDAIEHSKTEQLSQEFSLFSVHIIVIGFSLLFAFKILASSVQNYLTSFFNDAAFGSESPMHKMGTQAVAWVSANTVRPVASMAQDIVTHQTGRALGALGGGIAMLGSEEGRQQLKEGAKNFASKAGSAAMTTAKVIRHPNRYYNQAMQKAGEAVGKGVMKTGEAIKSGADYISAFTPIPGSEEKRQKHMEAINRAVDSVFPGVAKGAENLVAHGGGYIKQAARHPNQTYNKAMGKAGEIAGKGIMMAGEAVKKGFDKGSSLFSTEQTEATRQKHVEAVNRAVDSVTSTVAKGVENTIAHGGEYTKKAASVVGAVAASPVSMAMGKGAVTPDTARAAMHTARETLENVAGTAADKVATGVDYLEKGAGALADGAAAIGIAGGTIVGVAGLRAGEMIKDKAQALGDLAVNHTRLGRALKEAYQTSDQAPITLNPSAVISAPFKAVSATATGLNSTVGAFGRTAVATPTAIGKTALSAAGTAVNMGARLTGAAVKSTVLGIRHPIRSIRKLAHLNEGVPTALQELGQGLKGDAEHFVQSTGEHFAKADAVMDKNIDQMAAAGQKVAAAAQTVKAGAMEAAGTVIGAAAAIKNAKGERGRVIMQLSKQGGRKVIVKGGQIFFRSLKGTAKDAKVTGEKTAIFVGGAMQKLGQKLGDNRGHSWTGKRWSSYDKDEREELLKQQEERELWSESQERNDRDDNEG